MTTPDPSERLTERRSSRRRQADEALRTTKERLSLALEASGAGFWELDLIDHSCHRSLEHDRIFGYESPLPEWTYEVFLHHVVPEDRATVDEKFQAAMAAQGDWNFECRIRRADGETRWVWASGRHCPMGAGHPLMVGLVQDITGRKRTEDALRKAKEYAESLLQTTDAMVVGLDADGNVTIFNPGAERISGYTLADIKGKNWFEVLVPKHRYPHVWEEFARFAEGGSIPRILENPILTKSGEERTISWRNNELRPSGEVAGSISFGVDITERKRMEGELARSEAHFRSLIENASDLISVMDDEGIFRFQSPSSERILGYRPAELEGKSAFELVHPGDVATSQQAFGELMREERDPSLTFETRFRHKDGSWRTLEVTATRRVGPTGDVTCVLNSRDTTERKRAEELLKDEISRRRILFEQSSDGIVVLDQRGKVYEANQQYARMLGYSMEEVYQLQIWDWDTQFGKEELLRMLEEVDENGNHVATQHRRKDGTLCEVEISSNGAVYGGSKFIFCVCRDVTERKAAEKAVRESEDRYQTLVNLSPDAVIVSVGGKYAFANPAAARLLGAGSPLGLVGEDVFERIHPDYRELVAERAAQVRAGAVTPPAEIKLLRLDGSPVEVEATAARIEFDGSPASQVVFRDITERKRAEELLRLTRFSVDRAADSVFWTDSDGRLIFVSAATCRRHGYSRDEMLAMTLFDLDPSLSRERWIKNWERMKEQGAFTFETVSRAKNGDVFPVDATVNYVSYEGHEYNCAFIRDITERKRAEAERLQLERRLQHSQRLESLGVLAGGIAHDFNNILMSVLGNAELALTALSPSAPARQNLLEITASSRRAADLCRQMLAYSGRGHFVSEAIDLRALIEDMLGLLQSTISKKALLNLNLGKNLPSMRGDASQISQVIMNLVINASEAVGERSGIITISTGTTQCSGRYLKGAYRDDNLPPGVYLTLEVSDTGAGMDKATQERIFEPFYTTKFTGRGLGLSAVLGIVRGHQGALQLYSEVGKGTTFKILFPVSETAVESPARANSGTEGDWRGERTVLLVDDEETLRTLGAHMLASLGFEVLTAADGREALAVYAEHRDEITLVLLDLTMPHMDGEEAFRELRLLNPEVRVVMSSGYAEDDITARFAGKGLVGFVHKPYSLTDLREQLRVALEDVGPGSGTPQI